MTGFPGAPRLVRGGIVLIDPDTSRVLRIIALQYNPDSLTRTLQAQGIGGEPGDRLEALRLKGPPVETIKIEVEIDATDQLEFPDKNQQNRTVAQLGLFPQLAALETIVYPPTSQLLDNDNQASIGAIEIAPVEAPLTLFVWSKNRLLPVRLTDFSITEEAFDTALNPIRARVSLGMRVLTVNDLGFAHRGGTLFLLYQQQKERLAGLSQNADLGALGISSIPGG
ncbi:MAG: hypothetical protein ACTHMP_20785 [Thermomicrobiales bacterium]|jgi:hypothetical protein